MNKDLEQIIKNRIDKIKEIRMKLNSNAELSFREFKTGEIIRRFLGDLGIPTVTLAKTGVVGVLNSGGRAIGLRVDMDALPVNGVSHACGHDYHMAVGLGTAMILKEIGYKGCIKFIFQPAEEDTGGALPMIEEGVLKNPEISAVLGLHVWPELEVGKIEVCAGPSMASVDDFKIKFIGKGGHAAMPHLCKNPLYPLMEFVQSMNFKLKTEYNPLDSHVVTFSSVNGGNAPNVISDTMEVMGTVRTFNADVRNRIHDDIIKVSKMCAEKYGCSVDVEYIFEYPPLINDEMLAAEFIEAAKAAIGKENVLPLEKTFAAEDFSFFAEAVPSVHFRLGICDGIKGRQPLHASSFDASDEALYYGILVLTNYILNF